MSNQEFSKIPVFKTPIRYFSRSWCGK